MLSYSPNRVVDLPTERDRLQRPLVYHLFGKLSASPTYVISDEDLLEFICALQNEHLAPEKLFHELEHNHLLFIGSNFSNWLARLFLRMAKRQRLSDPRDVGEILADNYTSQDDRLVGFLQQVSVRTRIYRGAERFVDELYTRWQARRGTTTTTTVLPPTRFLPPAREMPDNAVFISYARDDLAAVQQIKAGLEAAGIITWFDMDRLEAGDDYDRKIRRNIAGCSYFIPVVSATTQRRLEGYFRREWSYAIDRARNMADEALFILPVCVDSTNAGEALVPDKFKALHFNHLPGGHVSPEFAHVAEESLVSRFTAASAAPDTLAVLVNRRLLRVEERLDIRRVELTHDVLCGVVKESRDLRQEREAREATERLLTEQKERELAARRALVKARQVAGICVVLAVVAVGAAVFAIFTGQRAKRAEREAQETRAAAEQARGQAEHLLGYLSDDFVRELESFGQLKVIEEFSQRQIDYFHALPPGLKGTETVRNGALAMVRHAKVMRSLGTLDVGTSNADEAIQLLEKQRAGGDSSEATLIALALAYANKAQIMDNQNDPKAHDVLQRAVQLLQPLAESANASAAVLRTYVEVLVRVGYQLTASTDNKAAIPTEQKAMSIAARLGARDLSNPEMGALYAEGGAWLVTALANAGRDEEATRVGEDAAAVAEKVLEVRPGYRLALHAEQVIEANMAGAAQDSLAPAVGLRAGQRAEQVSLTLLKLDPKNVTSLNNLGVAHQSIAGALWAQGKL